MNASSVPMSEHRDRDYTGLTGIAITDLASFGKIKVNGQILDAVAVGRFLSKGQKVKVLKRFTWYWRVQPI